MKKITLHKIGYHTLNVIAWLVVSVLFSGLGYLFFTHALGTPKDRMITLVISLFTGGILLVAWSLARVFSMIWKE
jgi:hypothetical protein